MFLCILFQEYTPPASAAGLEGTWRVSSATDLLQVHVNFLRGKVRLLLLDAQACQQDVSWSADLPTPGKADLCFRRQEEGLDSADLHAGCRAAGRLWRKEKKQPSSHIGRKLKGKDSPSWALDGQTIAPWKVDVKHGHGEAHTDQNEAYGKHRSNSCFTGTLLHFVCGCTLVCVCVYVCVCVCEWVKTASLNLYVVCMCVFPVSLTPTLTSLE